MPVHGGRALGDDGDLLCGYGIDDAEAGVALIDDQERLGALAALARLEAQTRRHKQQQLSHGKHYSRLDHCCGDQPLTETPEKDISAVPRTG